MNKIKIIFIFILSAMTLQAEEETSIWKRNINFQGNAGIYGELYSISGSSRRRPPSSGRIFFQPQMMLFNTISLKGDFFLSTEGSSARQDLNIYSLHPSWSWGNGHIGDFSENYSKYTFNGKQVRGLGINIYPGSFRFSISGGISSEAVSGNAVYKSYKQTLISSKIGYENSARNKYIHLIFLKAQDDKNSLPRPDTLWDEPPISDTMENPLDTIWTKPPELKEEITPAENTVGGLTGGAALFSNSLKIEFEMNGSAYAKDITTSEINMDSVGLNPFFADITSLFYEPREGSQFDFAGAAAVQWNQKNWNTRLKYDYIGPGYVSLGLPSQANDRQKIDVNTSYRFKKNRINVKYNRKNDNLLGQKDKTNVRNQFQTSYSCRFSNWQSQYQVSFLNQDNHAEDPERSLKYENISFQTNHSIVLNGIQFFRQAGAQYSFQKTENTQGENQETNQYHTFNLSLNGQLTEKITVTLSGGLNHQNSKNQKDRTTQIYSCRLTQNLLKKKLYNSLYVNSSMVRNTKIFRSGAASVFRLTKNNSIKFNLFYNHYQGTKDFDEIKASLNITHTF